MQLEAPGPQGPPVYRWKQNTAIFLISQAISIFGSSLVQFAITWYITLTTKSGVYSMLAIVCGILPAFFLSPFAGVWADRYNRKRLIILSDGAIALCTLIIALLFMAGHGSVWLLLAALVVRALGSAVQNPCISAMLPDIVPGQHLTRVNGLYGSVQSLITLVSPMLSGALLGMSTLEIIFFIDVITAAAAIVVMLALFRLPQRQGAQKPPSSDYFGEMKAGFAYIAKNKFLVSFFLFCVVYFFLSAPVAFLTPLQVARSYGDDVWRLTALEVTFSVGMMIGGVVMAAWGGLKNRVGTMGLATLGMGACTLALGVPIPFWLYLGVMGLFGLVMPMLNTPATVLLQEKVDPQYLGRVFGVMTMINTSVMPIGMIVFGPMADVVAIEWLLLGTGGILLVCSVAMLRNKALMAAGLRAENPQNSPAGTAPGGPP